MSHLQVHKHTCLLAVSFSPCKHRNAFPNTVPRHHNTIGSSPVVTATGEGASRLHPIAMPLGRAGVLSDVGIRGTGTPPRGIREGTSVDARGRGRRPGAAAVGTAVDMRDKLGMEPIPGQPRTW